MTVREIMTAPARTIGAEDSLNVAARMMRERGLGCLPVVDEGGTLEGILTDRDIALSAFEQGEALWKLRVADAMHAPVITCRADDAIAAALRLMREHRLRRLPVVDASGKPVGVISLDDIAHASRVPLLEPTPGVTSDDLGAVYDATSGRSKHAR